MVVNRKASDEEISTAYATYGTCRKAAAALGMCPQSVHERLQRIGIQSPRRGRRWTPEDDESIRSQYAKHRLNGTLRDLAKSLNRDYTTLACRAGALGLSEGNRNPKLYLRKIKDEEEARRIFDRFKRSSLGLLQFCAKNGIDDDLMRRHIHSRWPDEWDAVIESKAPRQTKYRLGRAFEYQVRDKFRAAGYFVLRSPRSGSPVDLVAVKTGLVVFVQCKRSGVIVSTEWNILFDLALSVGAVPVLAERPTGYGIRLWQMIGRKDGTKRAQPRAAFDPETS